MMGKWIGNFSLLLKLLKDAWMDMLPMSSMNETRRQNQYHADVVRELAAHVRLFPFSDSLTTLMFIVASDFSEAQREGLTTSLTVQGLNFLVYTFEAVKTVFVEFFCKPKSSMGDPSLRVNRDGSQTSRTFIVEEYFEDEFGQWAIDEVTGEQGYIDDEGSCF